MKLSDGFSDSAAAPPGTRWRRNVKVRNTHRPKSKKSLEEVKRERGKRKGIIEEKPSCHRRR